MRISLNLLWSEAGILEDGAADRADELLVHGALEPDHVVPHPWPAATQQQVRSLQCSRGGSSLITGLLTAERPRLGSALLNN